MTTTDDTARETISLDRMAFGLGRLISRQREFQRSLYGVAPIALEPGAKMEYLRTQSLALIDELHEALAETGWKPWATSQHVNVESFKGELVDVYLFFLNLMLAVEMNDGELMRLALAKQDKNVARQQQKYDGVSTKCPECKRAYDDVATRCYPPTGTGEFGRCADSGDMVTMRDMKAAV